MHKYINRKIRYKTYNKYACFLAYLIENEYICKRVKTRT